MFIFGRQQKARRPLLEYREREKLHSEEKLDREKKKHRSQHFLFPLVFAGKTGEKLKRRRKIGRTRRKSASIAPAKWAKSAQVFWGRVGVSTSRWKRRLWGMLLIARPVFSLLPRYQQWKKERGTGKTCNVQRCERKGKRQKRIFAFLAPPRCGTFAERATRFCSKNSITISLANLVKSSPFATSSSHSQPREIFLGLEPGLPTTDRPTNEALHCGVGGGRGLRKWPPPTQLALRMARLAGCSVVVLPFPLLLRTQQRELAEGKEEKERSNKVIFTSLLPPSFPPCSRG